jgi:hypothetical protein
MQNRNQGSGLNGAQINAMVQEEDLTELQELRAELQGRVDAAHENGRVYMMGQYVSMLAKVSADIKKIRDRFERESIAGNRRTHKELKLNARGESESESE